MGQTALQQVDHAGQRVSQETPRGVKRASPSKGKESRSASRTAPGAMLAAQTAGSAVAVAEPAIAATPATGSVAAIEPATNPLPTLWPVGLGLALAVLATFALGIVPMLLIQAANTAASTLLR